MIPFRTTINSITVTGTATNLKSLIDTAFSGIVDYSKAFSINHVELTPEVTVRCTLDGSAPTASTGPLLNANTLYVYEGATLDQIILISTTTSSKVGIQIGTTEKQP